jgi:hypothetical protein
MAEENESRQDMLQHQNEHSLRDFLKFSHFVASKSTFSYRFSHKLHNLHLKVNASGDASINFHHISQNATPAQNLHIDTT